LQIQSATITPLSIPFIEGFAHSLHERTGSDSVVVRIEAEDGTVGYGEGVPRPYVTGETVESLLQHTTHTLWPALRDAAVPDGLSDHVITQCAELVPDVAPTESEQEAGVRVHHAARTAMEIALLDCSLKAAGRALSEVLPPSGRDLCYSGVITSGSIDRALANARKFRSAGLKHYKVKTGFDDDVDRLKGIREILGPDVSIRIDANAAWTLEEALERLKALKGLGIESCEEPLGRERMADLPELAAKSPIPLMMDESLCDLEDGRFLAENKACHLFNLRISKCGGLNRVLKLVDLARRHEIGLQIGAHVGETSILSAAGRHLAAHLHDLRFLEGSYGTLLLSADITRNSLRFGFGGKAQLIRGAGLGVRVLDERISDFSIVSVALT
jgi:muconate cycloisomerase